MAGIGFELKKLFQKKGVLNTAKAYGYEPRTPHPEVENKQQMSRYASHPYVQKNPTGEPRQEIIHFIIYKKHGTVVADTPFFSEVTEGINKQCGLEHCNLQISYRKIRKRKKLSHTTYKRICFGPRFCMR